MSLATLNVPFPVKGLNLNFALSGQPPLTTANALNVRAYDCRSGRVRGAQRAGLSRYLDAQHSGTFPIQCLAQATTSAAYSGASSMNVRSLRRIAVSQGNVSLFDTSSFTVAAGGVAALSSTAPVIHAAELFGRVYFADGASQKRWTASSNTVGSWTPSAGSFPSNGGHLPRLIAMWRSRLVLSGLFGDEHNWFMTKVGDPLDFDYSPGVTTEVQAVAGNASNAGLVGDVITSIVPCNAETLVFGCDHSIWVMHGDPAAGGRLSPLSDSIGMAWGVPWCKDPEGNLFFFSSRGGVYRAEGCTGHPMRITFDSIDEELATVDLSVTLCRMAWNDREQGLHLWLTALDGSESTHYFYDARNQGWWRDRFSSALLNPVAAHVFDGDGASDRAILLGCRDGRVRKWDIAAETDDTEDVESYCYLGPLRGKTMQAVVVRELQGTLADDSGPVKWELYSGNSAEAALAREDPASQGVWNPGRNPSSMQGARGDSVFLKIGNSAGCQTPWALEQVQAKLELVGQEAQRAV